MARLSVIITTYNRVNLLAKAIESVSNQGSDIEVIVVDDCSTDGTESYCRSLDHIKYVRPQKNLKTAGARNEGIKVSTSPYIAFLDDDDWRLPGTFEEQIALFEQDKNCGMVHGRILYCNQAGELTGESNESNPAPEGEILTQLLRNNFIILSTAVVRKECIDKVGPFDPSLDLVGIEDWDLWLRIACNYNIRMVKSPVAVYRQAQTGSGQWSSNLARMFSLAGKAYKSKWFRLPEVKKILGDRLPSEKRRILNKTADVILSDALTNSKSFKEKWKKFLLAVKCFPLKLVQPAFYKVVLKGMLNK